MREKESNLPRQAYETCESPLLYPAMGWAGIEPATNKGRFYRALPTPIGEPTQIEASTGFAPASL